MRRSIYLALVAFLFLSTAPQAGVAHEGHHDDGPKAPLKAGTLPGSQVGVVELIGQQAALGVVFKDEEGKSATMREFVNMPTIITPVYFSCPNECNVLLGTLARVLPEVGLTPGKDFQVLAISFDDQDTPQLAKKRKNDFTTSASVSLPQGAWHFLTGDASNIKIFMDSIGFGFHRVTGSFEHPVVIVALSPSGKITRYLYGVQPMAFDIVMAATDAAGEKSGLSVKRAIAMCYTYDPQGRKYVFNVMRVAGFGMIFALGLFFLFLIFGGKKRPPKDSTPPDA